MGSKSKSKPKMPAAPPETALSKWAKNQYYPLLQQAYQGQGILPKGLQTLREQEAYRGIDDAYTIANRQLELQASQFLSPSDAGARRHLMDALAYQRDIAKDVQRRAFENERVSDTDYAQQVGFSAWGNELQLGIETANLWNNYEQQRLAQEAQYGTFWTNVAGGLGNAVTSLYFANKMAGNPIGSRLGQIGARFSPRTLYQGPFTSLPGNAWA